MLLGIFIKIKAVGVKMACGKRWRAHLFLRLLLLAKYAFCKIEVLLPIVRSHVVDSVS